MSFSFIYLTHRFFYRLFDFFHHWYADASRFFLHRFISRLERLDQKFAVKITLRYFFQPLYGDYTIMGRILGVIFRSGRILIGIAVFGFVALVFLMLYALWLLIPVIVLFAIF